VPTRRLITFATGQKLPFATPSVRENRFRAPQSTVPITNGIYNSSQAYDSCPQRTVNGTEDCLYLGLFLRPWSASQPLHPVVVVYFGGGFIEGGGSFTILPAGDPVLNVSSSRGVCGSGRWVENVRAGELDAWCGFWRAVAGDVPV
jgi:Carboxylesterase family